MKSRLFFIAEILIVLLLTAEICYSQIIPDGPYFGQDPPGTIPEIFAPGIISADNRYEYFIGFSHDLKECSFGVTNQNWSDCDMYFTKQDSSGRWSPITLAYFQGNGDGWMPFFTYDGAKLYFSSGRPGNPLIANIWKCEKNDSVWGNPTILQGPINSAANEWRPNTTLDGTLYFASERSGGFGGGDIYRSMLVDSVYLMVKNLGIPINTSSYDGAPFISPDEAYLVFESWRPGGYGQGDLYISFFNDSVWSEPFNLGPKINTNSIEDGAYISPDGKYFFFNRRESYITNKQTDIYWVDASIIFDTTSSSVEDINTLPNEFRLEQNYPNPFNPSTTISFSIPNSDFTQLKVYNVLGNEVQTLINENKHAGNYDIEFSATGGSASGGNAYNLPAGIYFYRLVSGSFSETKKMILLK